MSAPPITGSPAPLPSTVQRGIITPEAVVLEFETAGVASRVLARLVDGLVLFAALFAYSILINVAVGPNGSQAVAVILLVLFGAFVVFGYWIVLETMWGGRTVGKAALGLRVVTVEGAPITFRHAAIRAIIGVVDFLFPPVGPVAVITVLTTRREQRLGDLAAGTIVLRERSATEVAQPLQLTSPPNGDVLVAALRSARLDEQQYNVLRRFLLRAHEFSPEARSSLAASIAGAIVVSTGVERPAWLHPEWYLHAAGLGFQQRTGGVVGASWIEPSGAGQPPPPAGPRIG